MRRAKTPAHWKPGCAVIWNKAMSRRKRKEEHLNHEAWAIPYGDLITLLLAFFVVMYSISNVNVGKYRVLADSLDSAFNGAPRSIAPVQAGAEAPRSGSNEAIEKNGLLIGDHKSQLQAEIAQDPARLSVMDEVIGNVENTMADVITDQSLKVRRKDYGVEIELSSDVLFPSGSSLLSGNAIGILQRLATTLKPLPYPIRVEGHTDNVPINTSAFPSNWELSSARAASVVHLFMERGVDATHLSVVGLGEFRPIADNRTAQGRNRNRRVMIVILNNGLQAENANEAEKGTAPDGSPAINGEALADSANQTGI